MKKKLYYVVEKELREIDGIEETTGHKNITVYEIYDNRTHKFFDIDVVNEDNSIEAIQEWLDDNGYSDDEFEFIQL